MSVLIQTDKGEKGRVRVACSTHQEAKAFEAGVDFVNDSSLKWLSRKKEGKKWVSYYMDYDEDEDAWDYDEDEDA